MAGRGQRRGDRGGGAASAVGSGVRGGIVDPSPVVEVLLVLLLLILLPRVGGSSEPLPPLELARRAGVGRPRHVPIAFLLIAEKNYGIVRSNINN